MLVELHLIMLVSFGFQHKDGFKCNSTSIDKRCVSDCVFYNALFNFAIMLFQNIHIFTLLRRLLDEFLAWLISDVARCNLTFTLEILSFFSIMLFRMFQRTPVICVVYSDLKRLIWPNNRINSRTFSCYHFLQLSPWIITIRVH